MKGAFKGVRGVIVKPISGSLDFFIKTTEGASNMVKVKSKKKKANDESLISEDDYGI